MRVAAALLLLLAGAGTGLATVALHQEWWGLLLGLAATAASLVALARGWSQRLPFGLGWAGLVLWVAPTRPEGDFVLAADLPGYTVLATAVLVVVWSVATLPRRPRPVRGSRAPAA